MRVFSPCTPSNYRKPWTKRAGACKTTTRGKKKSDDWGNTIVLMTFSDQQWLVHFKMERRTFLLLCGKLQLSAKKNVASLLSHQQKAKTNPLFPTHNSFFLLFVRHRVGTTKCPKTIKQEITFVVVFVLFFFNWCMYFYFNAPGKLSKLS